MSLWDTTDEVWLRRFSVSISATAIITSSKSPLERLFIFG